MAKLTALQKQNLTDSQARARIEAEDLARAQKPLRFPDPLPDPLPVRPAATTTDRYGRLVMECCEAPATKITATGAYYSRHSTKGLLPACQQSNGLPACL